MSEFWFARRFPVGHRRNAMSPVSSEGWLVVYAFIAAMGVGALLFLWLGLSGSIVAGVIVFVLFAIAGGGGFLWMAGTKGDTARTVDDYRRMGQGERT